MEGLHFLNVSDLYNLLNQGLKHPVLSDPNYLLLLDARGKDNYEESHILTAKKAPKNENGEFIVPYDAELECKKYVVVYDGSVKSLKEEGDAVLCGKVMWDMGSRNPVHIVLGGYEQFSAYYPFMRTQKMIYMPRELDEIQTYPCEVLPGFMYIGNRRQGHSPYMQKDLKIQAHVACDTSPDTFFTEEGKDLMQLEVEDNNDAEIFSKLHSICKFIDSHKANDASVMIYSKLGISRCAMICIAYLMHNYKWPLKTAYAHLLKCCSMVRPNQGFVKQLSHFEKDLGIKETTDITDPNF